MPPQNRSYTFKSPKTGKEYTFEWTKPTPPTLEDFKALEAHVSQQEISLPAPSSEPSHTFGSRAMEFGSGLVDFANKLNPFGWSIQDKIDVAKGFVEPFSEFGDTSRHPHARVGRFASKMLGYNPDAIAEDYEAGNTGALIADLALPTALNVGGTMLGMRGARGAANIPEPTPVRVTKPSLDSLGATHLPGSGLASENVALSRGLPPQQVRGLPPGPEAPQSTFYGSRSGLRETPVSELPAAPERLGLPAAGESTVTGGPRFYQGQAGIADDLAKYEIDLGDPLKQFDAGDLDFEIVDPYEGRVNNASGTAGGGSAEEILRQRGMKAKGDQFVVYDKAGNERPIIGVDAQDYVARPGESFGVKHSDGSFTLFDDNGGRLPGQRRTKGTVTDAEMGEITDLPADIVAERGTSFGRLRDTPDPASLHPTYNAMVPERYKGDFKPQTNPPHRVPPEPKPILEHPIGGRVVPEPKPPLSNVTSPNRFDVKTLSPEEAAILRANRMGAEPVKPKLNPTSPSRFDTRTLTPDEARTYKGYDSIDDAADIVKSVDNSGVKVVDDIPETGPVKNVTSKGSRLDNIPDRLDPAYERFVASLTPAQRAKLDRIGRGTHVDEKAAKITLTGTGPVNLGKKFVKENPSFDPIYKKWVKGRQAAHLEQAKASSQVAANLPDIPPTDLPRFQADVALGKHPKIRKFFDDTFKMLRDNGIEVVYKDDYLPQMWKESAAEVSKKMREAYRGRKLSTHAPFTHKSVFQSYQEGINAGLTPSMTPKELVTWYAQKAHEFVADKQFFEALKKEGYIVPRGKGVPRSWQALDASYAPGTFIAKGKKAGTTWSAPPEVKKIIENITNRRTSLTRPNDAQGKIKQMFLSAGLTPKVPLGTFHGANIARRALFRGNFRTLKDAVKFGLSSKKGANYVKANIDDAIMASREHGLKLTVEDPTVQRAKFFEQPGNNWAKRGVNAISQTQWKFFEQPLFESMIPGLKLKHWQDMFAKFKKSGMDEAAAGKAATELTEDFFGGYNHELLYRNKNFQDGARLAFLAPDWYESSINLGVKIPKALADGVMLRSNPVSREYQKAAGMVLATYAVGDMMNYLNTGGKHLWENPPGKKFSVYLGGDADSDNYLKFMGTAADFVTIPIDIATSVAETKSLESIPRAIMSKGSPVVSAGSRIAFGEGWDGDPNIFTSTDRFGNPIDTNERIMNTIGQALEFGPPQISAPARYLMGQKTGKETIARLGELPITFKRKRKPKSAFGNLSNFGKLGGLQ